MKKIKIKLLVIVLLTIFKTSYGQWIMRESTPAPPAAVSTYTLRPVKMVYANSSLYTLYYLGNSSNLLSGRFTLKVTDLNGNQLNAWNYTLSNSINVNDFIVDQVSGNIVIVGQGGFIATIDVTTGALSYAIMSGGINLISVTQFNGINSSDLVVLGCNGLASVNVYVLNRTSFLIRAQASVQVGTFQTEGYGLAITRLSGKIVIGAGRYDNAWNPMFYAFDFNNLANTLTNIDIDPAGNTAVLYTPTVNQDGNIDAMDPVPGTDNIIFSYHLSAIHRSGVGIFAYNNTTPTLSSISFRSSLVNASFARRGLNIQVAPNGQEVTVGAMAYPGGGPLTPVHRIGLSTTAGVTSFTASESFFTPSVTVPAANPNSETVAAYDNSSNLYGYVNSYNFAARSLVNDRYFLFKPPALGGTSACFTDQTIGVGNNFVGASYAITIGNPGSTLGSFSNGMRNDVDFNRICEGCGDKAPVMIDESSDNFSFCATPGTTGIWFNPCTYAFFAPLPTDYLYTIKDLATTPRFDEFNSDQYWEDNHLDPCFAHHLPEGDFEILMYDKSNCTYKKLTIHVTRNTPTQSGSTMTEPRSFCATPGTTGIWFNPCTYAGFAPFPTDYMYTLKDLATTPSFAEFNSDQYIADNHLDPCFAHHLTEGSFEFMVYDKSNCTYKKLIVNVTSNTPTQSGSTMTEPRSFCATPGTTGIWFDPCTYAGFTPLPADYMYTLRDLATTPSFAEFNSDQYIADNHLDPCFAHHLTEGSFEFMMYDKTNCTYKKLIVNVTATTPTQNGSTINDSRPFCAVPGTNGIWFNPCTYSGFAPFPTDYMYTLKDLATTPSFAEFNSDQYVEDNHLDPCFAHHLQAGSYEFMVYDKTNCTYQKLILTVTSTTPTQSGSTITKNFTFNCDVPGTDGIWYNPCTDLAPLPADFMFTLTDLATTPRFAEFNSDQYVEDNHLDPCFAHHLPEGSFEVRMFDRANCTFTDVIINVTREMQTIICPTSIETFACGTTPNLENVLGACEDCLPGPGKEVTNWVVTVPPTLPESPYTISRQVIDPAHCKICIVNVQIEKVQETDITLNLYMQPCSTLNIRSLMCGILPGTIIRIASAGNTELGSDFVTYCCDAGSQPITYYVYEAIMPNGCICRLNVTINCFPVMDLIHPGSGNGKQNSENSLAGQGQGNPVVANKVNSNSGNAASISPNPSSGIFNIIFSGNSESVPYDIVVTDITGRVVVVKTGMKTSESGLLDLTAFSSGVYTVKITAGKTVQYIKLIKE